MILSCLPGASLSKAILCSERHFKGQSVLRAANRGAHPRICRDPGRSPLKLYQKLYKIRRPSKTGIRSAIDPFLPPWCLPGCPNGSFLPPWCLPGASLAVRWILSCLPGASQAVQLILSCLPGASQAVQMVLSCLPGASLSKAILCSKRHFKGQSVLRAANRGAHPRICREPGRSPLKLY